MYGVNNTYFCRRFLSQPCKEAVAANCKVGQAPPRTAPSGRLWANRETLMRICFSLSNFLSLYKSHDYRRRSISSIITQVSTLERCSSAHSFQYRHDAHPSTRSSSHDNHNNHCRFTTHDPPLICCRLCLCCYSYARLLGPPGPCEPSRRLHLAPRKHQQPRRSGASAGAHFRRRVGAGRLRLHPVHQRRQRPRRLLGA